jgi:hypothetical protein
VKQEESIAFSMQTTRDENKGNGNSRMPILCENHYLHGPKDRTESEFCTTSLNSMINRTGGV